MITSAEELNLGAENISENSPPLVVDLICQDLL